MVPGDDDVREGDAENEGTNPGERKVPSTSSTPLLGKLTKEMLQWLTDNREDYEIYLLHAMMHDPLWRITALSVPVTSDDFKRVERYAIVFRALAGAAKIMGELGHALDNPPSPEFLRTYVESAAREEGSDDEMTAEAMGLVRELQNPVYKNQHYCVAPYFEAWYGSVRAKEAARELIKVDVPDVQGILEPLQMALDAAASLFGASANSIEFDFDNPPEPPDPILKLGDNIICTPGNISNIQGQSKAGKSAVVEAIIAASMKQPGNSADTLGFTAGCPEGRTVVHFDTEQSACDHDALVRRAYRRANQREKVGWLKSDCLTGTEPETCWNLLVGKLKTAAEENGGIKLVIIDGIADFCTDPNDAEVCFGLIRKLHRLAAKYECAVLTVLHENPGGFGKTRGHLGSQLERKAETSLRVKKENDTGISKIWADNARHCFIPEREGWRFHWCGDARMHVSLLDGGEAVRDIKLDKKKAKFAEVASKVFRRGEELSWKDLYTRISEVTGLAIQTAKAHIPKYLSYGLIEKGSDEKYRVIGSEPPE